VLTITRVRVVGPSMEPAMANGEWWVARSARRPTVGDVVLMVHPARPEALIVKRLARREEEGWWVLGDNAASSEDSRAFGPVPDDLIRGVLWFRYHPLRRPRTAAAG
jgi:nickel-type superoxide dismutase maturation protease